MSTSRKGQVGLAGHRGARRRAAARAAYEDRADLAAFEKRATEPVISYKQLRQELKSIRGC